MRIFSPFASILLQEQKDTTSWNWLNHRLCIVVFVFFANLSSGLRFVYRWEKKCVWEIGLVDLPYVDDLNNFAHLTLCFFYHLDLGFFKFACLPLYDWNIPVFLACCLLCYCEQYLFPTIESCFQTIEGPGTVFSTPRADPSKVASIILGGGAGTRLFPLTSWRSKPAVILD